MAGSTFGWYKIVQLLILLFTMVLMLSKHYETLGSIFSVFYESEFSIICVVVGGFSIIHGFYMVFRAFTTEGHA